MKLTHPLLSPFEIEADSDQYTLIKVGIIASGARQGDRSETAIGYYTSLDACLKRLVKEQILADNSAMGLDEYVAQTIEKFNQITALGLAA